MISIDGLVPEYYLQPARLGLKVPNLVKMKLGGAYAEGVEGIFPTVTYPAHTYDDHRSAARCSRHHSESHFRSAYRNSD